MKLYRDYSDYLAERFPCKMQKLTVNAGFSCPNRDGTLGYGGCTYCNNDSFSPAIAGSSVTSQLQNARAFFARKYPAMRYIPTSSPTPTPTATSPGSSGSTMKLSPSTVSTPS